MLVHDDPSSFRLSQSHRQAKIEFDSLSVLLGPRAAHRGGNERHVFSGGDMHLMDIERDGLERPRKEKLPRLSVGLDSTRFQWWGDVEHQDVGRVVPKNAVNVFGAHGLRPSLDQLADHDVVGVAHRAPTNTTRAGCSGIGPKHECNVLAFASLCHAAPRADTMRHTRSDSPAPGEEAAFFSKK
jgi:hypothetical protein